MQVQYNIVKLNTLRADIFAESILAKNRENKFCETYKILSNRKNLYGKVWWSFNLKKKQT